MADVCLILEGTYPYVTGGVSSWVHDVISNLPDFTFDIIAIVPSRHFAKEKKYKLPANVSSLRNLYLNEIDEKLPVSMNEAERREFFSSLAELLMQIKDEKYDSLKGIIDLFQSHSPDYGDFFNTREGFAFFTGIYEKFDDTFSFIDFFWTMRFVLIPFINIIGAKYPECKCYHTVSTGYAGLLASIIKMRTGAGLILTEHGIYANERLLEISDSKWIYDENEEAVDVTREMSLLKQFWIKLFMYISKITYHCSDRIITLYRGNQSLQFKHGAAREKCSIIPNGIDVEKYSMKRQSPSAGPKFMVGYVGRIVPIKDIKTLIHAVRVVADRYPGVEFHLKGPHDEDEGYFRECTILVQILSLEKNIFFVPPSDTREFYKGLDLLVLSSISEAQPLVILEANICCVPVVSTDVGAVGELLFGSDETDAGLGASGIVVPCRSPQALGEAVIRLLGDPALNSAMGNAGYERVSRYYRKESLMSKYKEIYREYTV